MFLSRPGDFYICRNQGIISSKIKQSVLMFRYTISYKVTERPDSSGCESCLGLARLALSSRLMVFCRGVQFDRWPGFVCCVTADFLFIIPHTTLTRQCSLHRGETRCCLHHRENRYGLHHRENRCVFTTEKTGSAFITENWFSLHHREWTSSAFTMEREPVQPSHSLSVYDAVELLNSSHSCCN